MVTTDAGNKKKGVKHQYCRYAQFKTQSAINVPFMNLHAWNHESIDCLRIWHRTWHAFQAHKASSWRCHSKYAGIASFHTATTGYMSRANVWTNDSTHVADSFASREPLAIWTWEERVGSENSTFTFSVMVTWQIIAPKYRDFISSGRHFFMSVTVYNKNMNTITWFTVKHVRNHSIGWCWCQVPNIGQVSVACISTLVHSMGLPCDAKIER